MRYLSAVRVSPLAEPNRAKVMASKIVVFPALVSPEIRYKPLWPNSEKSSSWVPA